ncbi:MAG TPA: DinB family protein [Planctomycetaceae bacterium]|nr:DinB family protein [Planctomycetaceae bacterium]
MTLKTVEVLALSLRTCDRLLLPLLEDLRDAPLARSIPERGNHAHWIVGHLIYSEGRIVHEIAQGAPNPAEDLRAQFRGGSIPEATGDGYPPYEQLLERYRIAREETLQILSSLGEQELTAKPTDLSAKYDSFFPHKGACFIVCGMHGMHHCGQLADIRCRLGRPRLIA